MDCIATSVADFEEVKPDVKKETKKGVKEAAPRMKTRNKMSNPSLYSFVSDKCLLSVLSFQNMIQGRGGLQ